MISDTRQRRGAVRQQGTAAMSAVRRASRTVGSMFGGWVASWWPWARWPGQRLRR